MGSGQLPLTIVTFKWFDPKGRRNNQTMYGPQHVNTLKSMLARNLTIPHRMVCVTDHVGELDDGIQAVPLEKGLMRLGHRYPKLMLFRPDAQELFQSEWLLMMDLDCVVTGSLDTLLTERPAFKAWQNRRYGALHNQRYNTSMVLLKAGTRPQVYTQFNPERELAKASHSHFSATDQAWVSDCLGTQEQVWTQDDGVYAIGEIDKLPKNARIVFFPGKRDPTQPAMQRQHDWIGKHYH